MSDDQVTSNDQPKQCCDKCICEVLHSSVPPIALDELE